MSKAPKDTSLKYEADAAVHVMLVDQLADAYDYVSHDDATSNHKGAWRVILSPMFIIRQLNDSSAAVRTPSFMPRLSVEYMFVSRLGKVDPSPATFPGLLVLGLRGSLGHHSNGQAGCFRDGFVPVDAHSETCKFDGVSDTSVVKLNRANGDFSSTFLEVLGYSRLLNRNYNDQTTLSGGIALAGDVYPNFLFGQLTPDQRALYGSWRIRALAQGMWRPEAGIACGDPGVRSGWCFLAGRTRVDAEYVRAPRMSTDLAQRLHPPLIPYRWSVQISQSLDHLLGAGPTVRFVDGQDYYNIGFVHRRREVMIGLLLDLSGPDRIVKKSALP